MPVQRGSATRVYACPLIDDSSRFHLGPSSDTALEARVRPDHPRCKHCLDTGVDYIGAGSNRYSDSFTAT
jgi:hypothetical protein